MDMEIVDADRAVAAEEERIIDDPIRYLSLDHENEGCAVNEEFRGEAESGDENLEADEVAPAQAANLSLRRSC